MAVFLKNPVVPRGAILRCLRRLERRRRRQKYLKLAVGKLPSLGIPRKPVLGRTGPGDEVGLKLSGTTGGEHRRSL